VKVGCDIIVKDAATTMTTNIEICCNIMQGCDNREPAQDLLGILTLIKPTQLGSKKRILAILRCHKGKSLRVLTGTINPIFVEIQSLTGKESYCKHR
jgi:hypothetical protein